MTEIVKGKIGNALTSTAADHVVAVANDIYDESQKQYQNELNQESKGFGEVLGVSVFLDKSFIEGYYINTGVGVGNVVDINTPIRNVSYRYQIVNCQEGDIFIVSGTGGSSPRLYAFLTETYEVIEVASGNLSGRNIRLVAPAEVAYVVFNDNISASKGIFIKNNGAALYLRV